MISFITFRLLPFPLLLKMTTLISLNVIIFWCSCDIWLSLLALRKSENKQINKNHYSPIWFSEVNGSNDWLLLTANGLYFKLIKTLTLYTGNTKTWYRYQMILPFDSRLYLDISRSFKCPKSSPMVCLIYNYLRSVRYVLFILREYILKVHVLVIS